MHQNSHISLKQHKGIVFHILHIFLGFQASMCRSLWHVWHVGLSRSTCWAQFSLPSSLFAFLLSGAGVCGTRAPRILHSCALVLWHSLPPDSFCAPVIRAYLERHSLRPTQPTFKPTHTHAPHSFAHVLQAQRKPPLDLTQPFV